MCEKQTSVRLSVDDEKIDAVAGLAYRVSDTMSSQAAGTMAFNPTASGTASKHEAGRFLRRAPDGGHGLHAFGRRP